MSPVLKYKDPATGIWTALPATMSPPNEVVATLIPSASSNTASASYVNWPNAYGGPLAATLNKRANNTRVIVDLIGSGYVGSVGSVDWGVTIDSGASQLIVHSYYNVTGSHVQWSGRGIFSGLAIGPHTVTMQVKTGGPTLSYDNGDMFFLGLREVA